jgi:uncharacterized protein (TIGR02284 family)
VDLLNQLIKACRDSERRFAIAADTAHRLDLKRLFATYAKQRRRFAAELRVEVARLGGVLEFNGDLQGERRTVSRLAFAPTGDDNTLVEKLTHAENEAAQTYMEAEHVELNAPLRAVIDRQRTAIVAGRERIHALQQPSKKSA